MINTNIFLYFTRLWSSHLLNAFYNTIIRAVTLRVLENQKVMKNLTPDILKTLTL